jgi:hypothetical protein
VAGAGDGKEGIEMHESELRAVSDVLHQGHGRILQRIQRKCSEQKRDGT